MLQNITGQPSISLPIYWTEQGLPIGVQYIGSYGSESMLLRLSKQLEDNYSWDKKIPTL